MQAAVADLNSLKVPDLRTMLKSRGLKVSGKKEELIARLSDVIEDQPEQENEQREPEAGSLSVDLEHQANIADLPRQDPVEFSESVEEDASDVAESVEQEAPKGTIFVMPQMEDAAQKGGPHAVDDAPDQQVLRVGAASHVLPEPNDRMVRAKKLQKVRYMGSTTDPTKCPDMGNLPEIAFFGRSNVGKSSLLNMLTYEASKANVSRKAGTTQSIHHYLINNWWWLVDLPGYGFARETEEETAKWRAFTEDYFANRSTLAGVLLLIDSSVPPKDIDFQKADFLIENRVPFIILFTKCDRHKEGMATPAENMAIVKEHLMERWRSVPTMIATSVVNKTGRKKVLQFLSSVITHCRARTKIAKKERRRQRVQADPTKSQLAEDYASGKLVQAQGEAWTPSWQQRDVWWGNARQPTSRSFRENRNFERDSYDRRVDDFDRRGDDFGYGAESYDRRADPEATPEEVEEFLRAYEVDERACEALESCPPDVQKRVIDEGGLGGARNPSAVVLARIQRSFRGSAGRREIPWNGGQYYSHRRENPWDREDRHVHRHGQQRRGDAWDREDQHVHRYAQHRRGDAWDREDRYGHRPAQQRIETIWDREDQAAHRNGLHRREDREDYNHNGRGTFRDGEPGDRLEYADLDDDDGGEEAGGYYSEAMQRHRHFNAARPAQIERDRGGRLQGERSNQGDRWGEPRTPAKQDFYARALQRYADKKAARANTGSKEQIEKDPVTRSSGISPRAARFL